MDRKRSGQPEIFLQVLCDLSAMHFKYELDPAFNPTGRVLICTLSPHQAYDQYLTIEPVYDALLAAAQALLGPERELSSWRVLLAYAGVKLIAF